jgi:hypothetical protein
MQGNNRLAHQIWQTAFGGDQPLRHYEIRRNDKTIGRVEHRPQTTPAPFAFQDPLQDHRGHRYRVVTVDAAGRTAASQELLIPATG